MILNRRQLSLADASGPFIGSVGLNSQADILAIALALGAREVPGWTPIETAYAELQKPARGPIVAHIRAEILAGNDPLGEAYCRINSPAERRSLGATYTPQRIVDHMLQWAVAFDQPSRVVDPGTGSGRYLVRAGECFPKAELIGIEIDAVPAILARANLAAAGFAKRSRVILQDFRDVELPEAARTLYVGNPPYVRHHLIEPDRKVWLVKEALNRGHSGSGLAGLHVHFFMATAAKAQPGDFGAYITAAEWLDVNYGQLVRQLFLKELGGLRIDVIEPTAMPFPDAATTAAVTYFQVGSKPKSVRLKRVKTLEDAAEDNAVRTVRRERLETESRWSHLTRGSRKPPRGFIELGELCSVHRGQVTGLNRMWIAGPHSANLPESVLYPTVTKARELFKAGKVLDDPTSLRCVIDLPIDLDGFERRERNAIDKFLAFAKSVGAHLGYVASNRKAWWSVGLRKPAPILTTYMARRPPAFVRNQAQARHINIAHGLYPREPLPDSVLSRLIDYLSKSVCTSKGRTYAGGLTKFEPREMERLVIPSLELLQKGS